MINKNIPNNGYLIEVHFASGGRGYKKWYMDKSLTSSKEKREELTRMFRDTIERFVLHGRYDEFTAINVIPVNDAVPDDEAARRFADAWDEAVQTKEGEE